MRILHEDLDENLTWLTQKTEKLKCNRGNFTPPFQGYPPFPAKLSVHPPPPPPTPPSDSIFGRSYPLRGGEGSNYEKTNKPILRKTFNIFSKSPFKFFTFCFYS